jgi:hypothetical protein
MLLLKAVGMALSAAAALYLLTHHLTTAVGGGLGCGIAFYIIETRKAVQRKG